MRGLLIGHLHPVLLDYMACVLKQHSSRAGKHSGCQQQVRTTAGREGCVPAAAGSWGLIRDEGLPQAR